MKKLGKLGLAVFAALALIAVSGAAGASAAEFSAEKYSAAIDSTPTEGQQTLKFQSFSTKCDAPALEATLKSRNAALTANAKDTICSFTGPVGMAMNGCQFVYRPGAETSAGVYDGSFDIACPEGKAIQYGATGAVCLVTIGSQSGLKATYETLGSGSTATVKVNAQASGLKYTQAKGWGCTNGSFENGTWDGSWTLKASNGGSQTGLRLTHKGTISISGTPPRLTAASYPVSLVGQQATTHTLSLQWGKLTCTGVEFNSAPMEESTEFLLTPKYSGCLFAGLPATVNTSSCSYVFSIEKSGPPYTGRETICYFGGSITITTAKCTVTIGSQLTNAGGLSFTNEASTIGVGFSLSGIAYHQQQGTGLGACTTGDYTNGTLTGSTVLTGYL